MIFLHVSKNAEFVVFFHQYVFAGNDDSETVLPTISIIKGDILLEYFLEKLTKNKFVFCIDNEPQSTIPGLQNTNSHVLEPQPSVSGLQKTNNHDLADYFTVMDTSESEEEEDNEQGSHCSDSDISSETDSEREG